MEAARPMLIILANFIVGALVASGRVEPTNASDLTNQIADIFGLVIILVTSLLSLHKFVHKHPTDPVVPVVAVPVTAPNAVVVPVVQTVPNPDVTFPVENPSLQNSGVQQ